MQSKTTSVNISSLLDRTGTKSRSGFDIALVCTLGSFHLWPSVSTYYQTAGWFGPMLNVFVLKDWSINQSTPSSMSVGFVEAPTLRSARQLLTDCPFVLQRFENLFAISSLGPCAFGTQDSVSWSAVADPLAPPLCPSMDRSLPTGS